MGWRFTFVLKNWNFGRSGGLIEIVSMVAWHGHFLELHNLCCYWFTLSTALLHYWCTCEFGEHFKSWKSSRKYPQLSHKRDFFSPPLWKFQLSYILNIFELFGLPELPPPGNSNPFCEESVDIFWHWTCFCLGDKQSKICCKIKCIGKVKRLMPNELRVINVLSILSVTQRRYLVEDFFWPNLKKMQCRFAVSRVIALLIFQTNASKFSHELRLGFRNVSKNENLNSGFSSEAIQSLQCDQ